MKQVKLVEELFNILDFSDSIVRQHFYIEVNDLHYIHSAWRNL